MDRQGPPRRPERRIITPTEHWAETRRIARDEADSAKLHLAYVVSTSGADIAIRFLDAATPTAYLARVAGHAPEVGKLCVAAQTEGGEWIVLGQLDDHTDQPQFRLSNYQVPWLTWRGGRAYGLASQFPVGALTGQTITANRAYFLPFYYPGDDDIVGMTTEFATAPGAGAQHQMAIYDISTGGLPDDRVAVSSVGTATSTGIKTFGVTSYLPEPQRWYFVAFVSTVSFQVMGNGGNLAVPSFSGFSLTDLQTAATMFYQDLGAGWTELPTQAGVSNLYGFYLHLLVTT